MVIRSLRAILGLSILLLGAVSVCTAPVEAAGLPAPRPALPTLDAFVRQVMHGNPDQLQGIYASGLFADAVVQQPDGYPDFVARGKDVVTQFRNASELGSTGLLAHNYLAGRQFSLIVPGQIIHLVYGNGHVNTFVVTQLLQYRALQPDNPDGTFEDLRDRQLVDSSTLFSRIYGQRGALILQTCIAEQGLSTWGRLFVIAVPFRRPGGDQSLCGVCQ